MLNVLWDLFELFASLFQGFLFTAFTRKFLSCKLSKKKDTMTYFVISLTLFVSFVISNSITHFEGIAVFIFGIPLLVYSFMFLTGTVVEKIIAAIIPIFSNVIISSITFTFIANLFKTTVNDVLSSPSLERFLLVVISNLFLVYTLSVILKLGRKNKVKLNKTEVFLNVSILIISILIFTFLDLVSIDLQLSRYASDLLLGGMLGLVLIDLVVFYLVSKLSEGHEIKARNELLSQQIAYQELYTEQVKQQYETTMRIRHDFKHGLSVMDLLISSHEHDKSQEMLQEYIQSSKFAFIPINTKNSVLNAIVVLKLTYANSLGIKTFCVLPKTFDTLSDIDLCNLIGNMLDNAIEYCQNHANENNEIAFSIASSKGKYTILTKNTIHGSVLTNNVHLKTSKKNRNEHGFGIETIKNIAKKYGGLFDCYEENGMFYAKVVLYQE